MLNNSRSDTHRGDAPRNIPDWFVALDKVQTPAVEWPTPLAANYARLTPTERATIRITPPPLDEVEIERGAVGEAVMRIALFGERGLLPWASAHYVAQQLQPHLGGWHPGTLRYAKKGWLMIGSLAELGRLDIQISADPHHCDPTHWRRMSLVERLREFA